MHTLGTITDTTYAFTNAEWMIEKHPFTILSLAELFAEDSSVKEHFSKFWTAKSPYHKGKKEWTLEITDTLFRHHNQIKWYVESILLHELTDHDNSETSMLDAEKEVIKKIKESDDLTEEEKQKIIEYHLGFFKWNRSRYQDFLAQYGEKLDPQRLESNTKHHEKIGEVIKFLEEIIYSNVLKITN